MDEPSEQMMQDAKQVREYIATHLLDSARSIRYVVDEAGNRTDPPTPWENAPDSRDAT